MTNGDIGGDVPRSRAIEWDETKRRANLAKHGIDFLDAVEIFSDPRRRTFRRNIRPRSYATSRLDFSVAVSLR